MHGIRVLKFGGAALRDGRAVRRAVEIVRRSGGTRPVVVVSAVGDVTRRLEDALAAARRGELAWDTLRVRHRTLLSELGLAGDLLDRHLFELRGLLAALAERQGRDLAQGRRWTDQVLSFGERMSARLFAAALSREGLRAVPVDAWDAGLVTEAGSGELVPPAHGAARVRRALACGDSVPVVTGFVALDSAGHVITLGRNGSDLSAVWIGAALAADEVQLWKEVPGILRADPRLVPEAETLPEVGRAEAEALARQGAAVLHPGALAPAVGTGVAVWLRDVRAPDARGTRIVEESASPGPLALALRSGLTLVELEPAGARRERRTGTSAGELAGLFEGLAGAGAELVGCQADAQGVRALFAGGSGAPQARSVRSALACVSVVGRDLAAAGDLEARLLACAHGLDPEARAWSAERALGVLVRESSAADCVRALHDELFARAARCSPAAG